MFFLPNTTSFSWSVLMPVWQWQTEELPPEPLMDAVQALFDEALTVDGEGAAPAPAVTPKPAPLVASGRWVLAGWRDTPSYSLLRNVAAERVAEQAGAEDQEHTLSTARQRRTPGCGQP